MISPLVFPSSESFKSKEVDVLVFSTCQWPYGWFDGCPLSVRLDDRWVWCDRAAVGRAQRRAALEVINSERNEPCPSQVRCHRCETIHVAERCRWHVRFGICCSATSDTCVISSLDLCHGRHLFLFFEHWGVEHLLSRVTFEHRL